MVTRGGSPTRRYSVPATGCTLAFHEAPVDRPLASSHAPGPDARTRGPRRRGSCQPVPRAPALREHPRRAVRALATAGANLLAAGAVEEEALRAPAGAAGDAARRVALADYRTVARTAAALASADPASARIVSEQVAAERRARRLAATGGSRRRPPPTGHSYTRERSRPAPGPPAGPPGTQHAPRRVPDSRRASAGGRSRACSR